MKTNFRLSLWLLAATLPTLGQEALPLFDEAVQSFMSQWSVPGAALAVVKDGRLVYARGYGLADVAAGQPVDPHSLFRIGSVSKTVTAMTVLRLVEEGKLRLDDKVFDILTEYRDLAVDSRARQITLRHLLNQTSGLMLEEDVLPPASELVASGVTLPLTQDGFVREALSQPMAFHPGEQFYYLSLNAGLMGKIIERTVGEPYETYVRDHVLAPMGITRMRLARPFATQRAIGEVHYYDYPGAPEIEPYYPNATGPAPQPYGGVPIEALGATGAWIASPIDLVRFAAAIDGSRPPRHLSAQTVQEMLARPAAWPETAQGWYGFGWVVQPGLGGRIWWHNGGMNGASAFLMHSEALNLDVALAFNTLPLDEDAYFGSLYAGLEQALGQTRSWPLKDLFPAYYEPTSPCVFAGGLVNTAGMQPGPIAPGQLVSVFGLRLGPEDGAGGHFDGNSSLGREIAGVRVLFNGVPAPLLYASDGQVNAVVPYGLGAGEAAEVVVERSGVRSEPVRARVAATAPALFTESGDSRGQVLALNEDFSRNSEGRPAAPGSIVVLYGTGAGQMSPAASDGKLSLPPVAKIAAPVRVTVAGREAEVVYAGAAPLLVSGTFQVNVRIPGETPGGPAAVAITIGEATNQQEVSVAVR